MGKRSVRVCEETLDILDGTCCLFLVSIDRDGSSHVRIFDSTLCHGVDRRIFFPLFLSEIKPITKPITGHWSASKLLSQAKERGHANMRRLATEEGPVFSLLTLYFVW